MHGEAMNRIRFNLVLLFLMMAQSNIVSASIGSFSAISPRAFIADDAEIGSHVNIDDGVEIAHFASVGSFANIGAGSKIGESTQVREHTSIGPSVLIGNQVLVREHCAIDSNVKVGDRTQISEHCMIGSLAQISGDVRIREHSSIGSAVVIYPNVGLGAHVAVGSHADIGMNSFLAEHTRVGNSARLKPGVILDKHASVGENVIIDERSYVGSHAIVGNGQRVGREAVIHEYTHVDDDVPVTDKQVAIGAPSTNMLFDIIAHHSGECSNVIEPSGFDPSIMNLVRQQWNELKSQCEHGIPRRMPELSCIVHIYLTEYFGQERFNTLWQRRFAPSAADQTDLYNTYHFGPRVAKQILSMEATAEVAKLLAVEKDIRRELRVPGDEPCQMISDIGGNQRNVVVKMPSNANMIIQGEGFFTKFANWFT